MADAPSGDDMPARIAELEEQAAYLSAENTAINNRYMRFLTNMSRDERRCFQTAREEGLQAAARALTSTVVPALADIARLLGDDPGVNGVPAWYTAGLMRDALAAAERLALADRAELLGLVRAVKDDARANRAAAQAAETQGGE